MKINKLQKDTRSAAKNYRGLRDGNELLTSLSQLLQVLKT